MSKKTELTICCDLIEHYEVLMVLIVDTNKNFTRLLVLKDVRDSFFPCENEKKKSYLDMLSII
jgi:hypothetical protein